MKSFTCLLVVTLFLVACSPAKSDNIPQGTQVNPTISPGSTISSPGTSAPGVPTSDEPGSIEPVYPISDIPSAQPTFTLGGDANQDRSTVYIDSIQLLVMESYPVQIMLSLQGNLPTPCHSLRTNIQTPDTQKRIFVDVYSVSDPDAICIQVLKPFDVNIPLGSFPAGHYTVWVNGEKAGEFDS